MNPNYLNIFLSSVALPLLLAGCSDDNKADRTASVQAEAKDWRPDHYGLFLWNGSDWIEMAKRPNGTYAFPGDGGGTVLLNDSKVDVLSVSNLPSLIYYSPDAHRASVERLFSLNPSYKVRYEIGEILPNQNDNKILAYEVVSTDRWVSSSSPHYPVVTPLSDQRDMIRFDFYECGIPGRNWFLVSPLASAFLKCTSSGDDLRNQETGIAEMVDCRYVRYTKEAFWDNWMRQTVGGAESRDKIQYTKATETEETLIPAMERIVKEFQQPIDVRTAVSTCDGLNKLRPSSFSGLNKHIIESMETWIDEASESDPLSLYIFLQSHKSYAQRLDFDAGRLIPPLEERLEGTWQEARTLLESIASKDSEAYRTITNWLANGEGDIDTISLKAGEYFTHDVRLSHYMGWIWTGNNPEQNVYFPRLFGDYRLQRLEKRAFVGTTKTVEFEAKDLDGGSIKLELSGTDENYQLLSAFMRVVTSNKVQPVGTTKQDVYPDGSEACGDIDLSYAEDHLILNLRLHSENPTPYFPCPQYVEVDDFEFVGSTWEFGEESDWRGFAGQPLVEKGVGPEGGVRFRFEYSTRAPGAVIKATFRLPARVIERFNKPRLASAAANPGRTAPSQFGKGEARDSAEALLLGYWVSESGDVWNFKNNGIAISATGSNNRRHYIWEAQGDRLIFRKRTDVTMRDEVQVYSVVSIDDSSYVLRGVEDGSIHRARRLLSDRAERPMVLEVAHADSTREPKSKPTESRITKDPASMATRVKFITNRGDIIIELNRKKAPVTVENFLGYVQRKHYDGTVFHRVIRDFMIQGGGLELRDGVAVEKPTGAAIRNEASNGLTNIRGTVAMARTSDPDSATAQFFINVKDNPSLDKPNPDDQGYTVFGKIVEGMDVVDAISRVRTGTRTLTMLHPVTGQGVRQPAADVPMDPIVIVAATLVEAKGEYQESTSDDAPADGAEGTDPDAMGGNLPGERFPGTRLKLLAAAEVSTMELDDVRYAINEMFARHGASFTKVEVSALFTGFAWYRPRRGISFTDLEKEFSEIERSNLLVLAEHRKQLERGKSPAKQER